MKRERITITIDADLLPAVDELIDNESVRNRSHALELAVKRGLSLHEVSSVYFIYGNNPVDVLPQLADRLAALPLSNLVTIAPAAQIAEAQAWTISLSQLLGTPTVRVIPGDFGDASALLLDAESLSPTFLLVDVSQLSTIPNLLPAHSFHRQRTNTVTHLVAVHTSQFIHSGISFVEKEIVVTTPPGKASLQTDVFPALVKAGKVSVYVCQ